MILSFRFFVLGRSWPVKLRSCAQWFSGVVAIFAFVFGASAEVIGEDTFETAGFSLLWTQTNHVQIRDTGGAGPSAHFATIGRGGELVAQLAPAKSSADGLSDFYLEFNFRVRKSTQRQFNLQIGTGRNVKDAADVNLIYEANKGWCVASLVGSGFDWQPVVGLDKIAPEVWYRLVFTGRNWGQTNAHYALQLVTTDESHHRSATTNLTAYQIKNSGPTTQPARTFAFNADSDDNPGFDVDEVRIGTIAAYKGLSVKGVDTQTLFDKVMCGYQGWFGVPGDGSSARGWRHWTKSRGPLADGNAKVDLWPDVSELLPGDRFATGFQLPDGRPAEVFSSYKTTTVLKHFQWMEDYGIDGAFVQRFAGGLRNQSNFKHVNTVLANCREGANLHGRAYAVMYDLSGLAAGHIDEVMDDWRALRREMAITDDPAYLHHHGKPVVAVWGIGFSDHRDYTLAECRRLIEFLKNDSEAGGCTVMVGLPAHWRTLTQDAMKDPQLLEVAALADIISPWTVGRYSNPAGAVDYATKILKPDQAWCRERGIDYLPVVFPGFSWHNMYGSVSDQIPRRAGQFLWTQFCEAKRAGASMIYVAMFDEVDEGTAIFKCVNDVPVGHDSKFVTFEGLPSDYYLRLVGAGAKLLRGEIPLQDTMPVKTSLPAAVMSKTP